MPDLTPDQEEELRGIWQFNTDPEYARHQQGDTRAKALRGIESLLEPVSQFAEVIIRDAKGAFLSDIQEEAAKRIDAGLQQIEEATRSTSGALDQALAEKVHDLQRYVVQARENLDLKAETLTNDQKAQSAKLDAALAKVESTLARLTEELDERAREIAVTAVNLIEGYEGDDRISASAIKDLPEQRPTTFDEVNRAVDGHAGWLAVTAIHDLNERIEQIARPLIPVLTGGGSGSSELARLIDVNLSGLTKDAQGRYILGSGTGSGDVSGYVPYTGAMESVNLGQYGLNTSRLTIGGELTGTSPFTFPSSDGSTGYYLATDGNGGMYWDAPPGSAFVPYNGAANNVDLGTNQLFTQGIQTIGDSSIGGVLSVTTAVTTDSLSANYANLQSIAANQLVMAGTYSFPTVDGSPNQVLTTDGSGNVSWQTISAGGTGTVTSVSVVNANGISGSIATSTTTPAITLALGAITPSSVVATGTISASNLSGTNTGDQTSVTGNAGTATKLATARSLSITGDITYTSPSFDGSANVSAAATLASVNSNVGSFTYASITVNNKGLITAASNGSAPLTNPMTTLGDIIYEDSTPTPVRLAGNMTTTKKFLTQTGNGTISAAPAWGTISASDIPTLNQNTTGSAATLTTPRAINGVNFNGSSAITITAAAATLTGTTLNSSITIASIGTLANLTSNGLITTSGGAGTLGVTVPGTGVLTALGVNVGSAGAFTTFNGAGGTPSSLTLTNASGLPISGLVASTSAALGVGTIELGHASDTTIARSAAGVITVEGVVVDTVSAANTLTNKTLTTPTITNPAMNATNPTAQTYAPASAGTATLDLSLSNQHEITMPAGNITIALSNATNSKVFMVSITQDGTGSRGVTWFPTIRWAGGTPPTLTTTANKRDVFGFRRTGTNTYDGFVIGQNI